MPPAVARYRDQASARCSAAPAAVRERRSTSAGRTSATASGSSRASTSMLDRRWLTNDGPLVQEFEQTDRGDSSASRHCVAMCNATVALEIAIRALGLTGEVIVPVVTRSSPRRTRCSGRRSRRSSATSIRAPTTSIRPRRAPDHAAHDRHHRRARVGRPCDMAALDARSRTRHRPARSIFDAAHAFGCSHARPA